MRRAETIVFAFSALGETGQTAALAQRTNPVAPLGQDFVGIGLMADIPYDAVGGRIKNMMYCNRQFHNTKTGAKMTTRDRNRADRLGAKLCRNLRQITFLQFAKIGGRLDCVEQWGR